jgi:hypothetical protein
MDAREYSPKSMVHVFIVHTRWGLLGGATLAVAVSVSRVLFGPRALSPAPGYLTELSTCCVVSSSLASSAGLAVATLVASSPPN